jgi:hypothetical protein
MPRATGRYSGCYVRVTVSGDFSDHTLASDSHLHTCDTGTRGRVIVRYLRRYATTRYERKHDQKTQSPKSSVSQQRNLWCLTHVNQEPPDDEVEFAANVRT